MKKPAKGAKKVPRATGSKPSVATGSKPVIANKDGRLPKPEPSVLSDRMDSKQQIQVFEKAMSFFHKRDFSRAREHFEKALEGPAADVKHTALMYIKMCERRMSAADVTPKTPDEYYNYGVSLMNRGEHDKALNMLKKAVHGNDRADHYHYALALCAGLRADWETSAAHLRRAIELQPGNRVAARNDAEFQAIAHQPLLREILSLERSSSSG